MTFFAHSDFNPHHLSVGGIVRRANGGYMLMRERPPLVNMLTETVESHESLEQALRRGFLEELDATVEEVRFAGCTQVICQDTWRSEP